MTRAKDVAIKHTPIVSGQLFSLSWSEVMEQYENLIKFASKSVIETLRGQGFVVDGMISSEDLYQEGLTCLWVCWSKYGVKDMEEFGKLFKKSLFRVLKRKAIASHIMVDLDEVLADATYTPEIIDNLYIKEGIKQLQDCLNSPLSAAILQELISPSPRTVWEVWADKERKKTLKRQGKKVNVPNTNEIKIKHIRAALGITPKQMDLALLEMRQVAEKIYNDFTSESCLCRMAFQNHGYNTSNCTGCDGSCFGNCCLNAKNDGILIDEPSSRCGS